MKKDAMKIDKDHTGLIMIECLKLMNNLLDEISYHTRETIKYARIGEASTEESVEQYIANIQSDLHATARDRLYIAMEGIITNILRINPIGADKRILGYYNNRLKEAFKNQKVNDEIEETVEKKSH